MNKANDMREINSVKSETIKPDANNDLLRKIGIFGAVALAAFLLGFVPMWLSARNTSAERDAAVKTLRPSVLQNTLATATINARRGEFEQARQQASEFFTDLRAEVDRDASAFDDGQIKATQPILAQRDDAITQLARNDAAAVERLTDLYFAFMQMKNSTAPEKK